MNKRSIISLMAISLFGSGFISINYGFSKIISFDNTSLLEALTFIMSGLMLIVLSAKVPSLIGRAAIVTKLSLGKGKWSIAALLLLLMLQKSVYAQESQSSIQLKNIEVGSSQISDSDAENFRNYFVLFKFRLAKIEEIKLWIHQYEKRDLFGSNSLQNFQLEAAPLSWLSVQAGYAQMPVGSFRIGKSFGPLYLAVGAGRDAVISRSNAIAGRLDYKSGYADFSVNFSKRLSLGLTAERGRFRDDNNLRALTPHLAISKQFGKFRIKSMIGYSERKLDHFSLYYWSPEKYREIFVAPDFQLELESFWIILNISVDRILEERFNGSAIPLRSWGFNGELSIGFGLGPGSIYLTGRYWNSGVQKFNSAYSGQILQASYELSISE
ncbi:MAG: hypothetical protein ACE5IW_08790 [bacterium]